MEEERYYAGWGLDQISEAYPTMHSKKILPFAIVLDKCCEAFGINGDLYSIILKDKTCLFGIVRSMNWQQLGVADFYIDLELRSSKDFPPKDRFLRGETKRINLFEIDDVELVKRGNEEMTNLEMDFVMESAKEGKTEEYIQQTLNGGD